MSIEKIYLESFRVVGFLIFIFGIIGFFNVKGGNGIFFLLGLISLLISLSVSFSYLVLFRFLPSQGTKQSNRKYFQPYLLLATILILYIIGLFILVFIESH